MLFERQRRLLTLLDAVGEPVGHTDFQKLLFFYTRECEAVVRACLKAVRDWDADYFKDLEAEVI